MLLKDMDAAVDLIVRALEEREHITVYGDYDADGLTATALLLNFFSDLGIPASFYIPNRFTEGYGLNLDAVKKIAKRQGGVIITVDCGTANHNEIAQAQALGMRVVVTDHHQVPEDFSPLCPVVNPHRPDSAFPFQHLAGVGVAFFLAITIRAALREKGWFKNRPETDLRDYLDLVTLGTVADMVPLLDQNRILVKTGLERIHRTLCPGIYALQQDADIGPSPITPYDVAFKLAPRLNASGRLGDAETGILALTTNQPDLAKDLAGQLSAMNSERQSIERHILEEIEEIIASMDGLKNRRTLIFSGKGWHRGVLGIVASRLVDKHHRPALVLDVQDGAATGSGRSIPGFNLYQALTRLEHLFERFGGHYHAVGFSMKASNVETLARELETFAQDQLSDDDMVPALEIDAQITLPELFRDRVSGLEAMSPFGPGNPEPLLYAHALQVIESRIVGENHLKLRVQQESSLMEAIGFDLGGKHSLENQTIDMVFVPEINRWQGYEKVQLRIIDLEKSGQPLRALGG
jgi:single-stranded-DNA-specific exonuclease